MIVGQTLIRQDLQPLVMSQERPHLIQELINAMSPGRNVVMPSLRYLPFILGAIAPLL